MVDVGSHASSTNPVITVPKMASTGVPLTAIPRGGSYVTRFDLDATGNTRGLIRVTFTVRSLGTVCLSFSETLGTFSSGMSSYR